MVCYLLQTPGSVNFNISPKPQPSPRVLSCGPQMGPRSPRFYTSVPSRCITGRGELPCTTGDFASSISAGTTTYGSEDRRLYKPCGSGSTTEGERARALPFPWALVEHIDRLNVRLINIISYLRRSIMSTSCRCIERPSLSFFSFSTLSSSGHRWTRPR